MLYLLRDELKGLGYDAEIVLFDTIKLVSDDTIVVYPEVVEGNPLKAKNVVRYFLNREGLASGNRVNPSPDDFILAFNAMFHASPQAIVRYENLNPHVYLGSRPTIDRRLDCTYMGKGVMYSDQCKVVEGTIEITRSAPADRQGLADLLRQTRFLYTFDVCSALNSEAIICGAVVVPLMFNPYKAEELEFPFGSIVNGAIHVSKDYGQKREAYLSMIQGFNLAAQTAIFAQMAIAYFLKKEQGGTGNTLHLS